MLSSILSTISTIKYQIWILVLNSPAAVVEDNIKFISIIILLIISIIHNTEIGESKYTMS